MLSPNSRNCSYRAGYGYQCVFFFWNATKAQQNSPSRMLQRDVGSIVVRPSTMFC